METIGYILLVLAAVNLVFTLMPFVRSDYWTFRIFDFPRLQKLVLSTATLVLMCCFYQDHLAYQAGMILLFVNCLFLLKIIVPYTFLYPVWVKKARNIKEENCVSLVVSNVFQDNTAYRECVETLLAADADIVLLLEADQKWKENVSRLEDIYPYRIHVPLDNTYGMLFYSKLPVRNESVHYQVEEDIPSIFCQLQLPSGIWVQLYCLHPAPPSPTENLRSTERDQELLLTAEKVKEQKLPVIVMGDLNDVAWSYTTELFLKMSGLLDPRIGRGFYNSFNARTPLMRFPLDHVFISSHFEHIRIKRLPNFNSDHFPIYAKYHYNPVAEKTQESLEPTAEDREIAQEKRNAV